LVGDKLSHKQQSQAGSVVPVVWLAHFSTLAVCSLVEVQCVIVLIAQLPGFSVTPHNMLWSLSYCGLHWRLVFAPQASEIAAGRLAAVKHALITSVTAAAAAAAAAVLCMCH
jgi:hypothetical protein